MKKTLIAAALGCTVFTLSHAAPVNCGKEAESIAYLVDYSGSIMEAPIDDEQAQKEKQEKAQRQAGQDTQAGRASQTGLMSEDQYEKTRRIVTVKTLLKAIAEKAPLSRTQSGIYSVAPYTVLMAYGKADKNTFDEAVDKIKDNMEVLGRRSTPGWGIDKHGETLKQTGLTGDIYLITDGEINRGREVSGHDNELQKQQTRQDKENEEREADESEGKVIALQTFYANNPDACLKILSLAETEQGRQNIEKIVSYNPCSSQIGVKELVTDNRKLETFIAEAYGKKPCPPEKAEPKVLSITGINFAFDKYDIDKKSEAILRKALEYIHAQPEGKPFTIQGWTDAMGSDAYNKRLSQRRAEAVRDWLVKNGIAKERMTAVGKGKSFRYDNKTAEGRYQNRRMDFVFE